MSHFSLTALIAGILLLTISHLSAQKLGHVNYGNLLEGMSSVKAAQDQHAQYRDSLASAFEAEVAAHRQAIETHSARYQAGELTPAEAKRLNEGLNQKEQKLANKQAKIESMILDARRVLMEPIIRDAKQAIEDYGREEGYLFIFDEASGFLLYDVPSDDLTDTIRGILES